MFIYEDMPGFPVMVVDWDIPVKRVKSFLNIISFSLTTNSHQPHFWQNQ